MLSRPSAHLAAAALAFLVALSILAASPLDGAFAAKPGGAGASERPLGGGSSGGKPGGKGPGKGQGQGGGGQSGGGGSGGGSTAPGAGSLFDDDEEPSYGSVNPLDVHNPLCDESLKPGEKRNCENTGSPETRYPTSNYGLEEHIDDSGSAGDTIRGSFQVMLVQIANAIWMASLFVLNLVLTLLGWAFELNPFSDNQTMREVSDSLERFYRAFTSPWIVVAFVCLGVWGMWKGLFKREVTASIAGMGASVVLMVGGLIVLHEPRDTVGAVSNMSDNAAQTIVGAPLAGSLTNPAGSYASATRSVWNAMTLPGFAALNFTDVGWALGEPEDEIVAISDASVCADYLYGGGADGLTGQTMDAYSLVATGKCQSGDKPPPPDSNAEIWLRSSTGSPTRQRLWEEVTDDTEWSKYLSIQGGGGAWTRLPLVMLIALGLLGGILLLGWLAVRLLMQTAVAFVMLLATPLALFMPAFGDRGRAAFVAWATTLIGALISKLVYAGLLAVVLFATNTVAALAGNSGGLGTMTAFLIMAGLWWSVFLKRETLLSFLTVSGPGGSQAGGSGFLSNYLKYKTTGAVLGAIPGLGGRGGDRQGGGYLSSGGADGDDTDPVARNEAQLDKNAEKRLDAQYRDAEGALGGKSQDFADRDQELGGKIAAIDAARSERDSGVADAMSREEMDEQLGGRSGNAEQERSRLVAERKKLRSDHESALAAQPAAAALIAGADSRKAETGKRWSPAQLQAAREEIRAEADEPASSSKHAWRVGMSPQRYEKLEGSAREEAHRKVRAGIRADQSAFGTIANQPKGIVGRTGDRAAGAAGVARSAAARGKEKLPTRGQPSPRSSLRPSSHPAARPGYRSGAAGRMNDQRAAARGHAIDNDMQREIRASERRAAARRRGLSR